MVQVKADQQQLGWYRQSIGVGSLVVTKQSP